MSIRLSNNSPTVFGVGCFGEGRFTSKSPEYRIWKNMLSRCYNINSPQKYNENVRVCDSWLNYQEFASWCEKTRPSSAHELDKDLSGELLYSPETCYWLPSKINSLLNIKRKKAGEFPPGVFREGKKFRARCSTAGGYQLHLGTYSSVEEAFDAYCSFKKTVILELADQYFNKGLLDGKTKELLQKVDVKELSQCCV